MKVLLVNTMAGRGSVGKHVAAIATALRERGASVAVAASRGNPDIAIGSRADIMLHGAVARLLGANGLASRRATARFIRQAEEFNPDIVHLHNIHGYYLHYPTLFRWLVASRRRVLWSLHDCWAFTGHCASFCDCTKWQRQCSECPMLEHYPKSIVDRSAANFRAKKLAFTSVPSLTLLPVSRWLQDCLRRSFLSGIPSHVVHPDVDSAVFRPAEPPAKLVVLGVATKWTALKGIDFFARLRRELPADVEIRLAGILPAKAGRALPSGITLLGDIVDDAHLARHYAAATVVVNPSRAETWSMVNREALACGTPVVSRRVGGACEDLDGCPAFIAADTDDGLLDGVRRFLAESTPELRRAAAVGGCGSAAGIDALMDIYGL